MMKKKKFLMDVVAIRLSLIFLLVVYHALSIYTGAWDSPFVSDIKVAVYEWLGLLMHSFRLETMVFISGLLLGYNALVKPGALSFHSCVVKKAKRILLPSLFFGVIYYAMFYDLEAPWYRILLKLLNGCGHLWFLPMIFWCFVIVYIVSITPPQCANLENKKYRLILLIAFCFSIVNPLMLVPFGLGRSGHFFIYFFMGYCLKTKRVSLPETTRKNIGVAVVTFVASFLFFMLMRIYMPNDVSWGGKAIRLVLTNFCHTANALSAIYLIYAFANRKAVLRFLGDKPMLITLSGYCYGVYIYHQFILKLLYYHTQLPFVVSAYWLPWIATVITIVCSLVLCHYSLKTRLGRFLIG